MPIPFSTTFGTLPINIDVWVGSNSLVQAGKNPAKIIHLQGGWDRTTITKDLDDVKTAELPKITNPTL